jgi:hypothetical protein
MLQRVMRALRACVIGIALAIGVVLAGLVSCASTPPPGVRNGGDDPTDYPCASISCPDGYHCLGGTCVPGYAR